MPTKTDELLERALAATVGTDHLAAFNKNLARHLKNPGGPLRTLHGMGMASAMRKVSESRAKKIAAARKLVPNLLRRHPVTKELVSAELRPNGDDYDVVFKGGKSGQHSILASMSDTDRIVAHWNGYLRTNGIHPYAVGDKVGFYGPYNSRDKAASQRRGLVTHVSPTALTVTYEPLTMPGVKRTKTLKMNEVWLLHIARPKQETT
jgi:hypothetical protein